MSPKRKKNRTNDFQTTVFNHFANISACAPFNFIERKMKRIQSTTTCNTFADVSTIKTIYKRNSLVCFVLFIYLCSCSFSFPSHFVYLNFDSHMTIIGSLIPFHQVNIFHRHLFVSFSFFFLHQNFNKTHFLSFFFELLFFSTALIAH